jgi:hypothetical protein
MMRPVNGRCAGRTGFGRSDGGVEGVKNLLKKVALRDDGVKGSEALWLIINRLGGGVRLFEARGTQW